MRFVPGFMASCLRLMARPNSPAAEILEHCFRPRLDVQLAVHFVEMAAHGAQADAELITDFLVEPAGGQQGEDFLLARGESCQVIVACRYLLKKPHHLSRDLHRHRRSTGMNLL